MSAVDAVLAIPQTDDAGAQTADRYEWQAAMAAADGLGAYALHCDGCLKHLDISHIRVICEYHEDWIIQLGTEAELVSAKHREQSSGPWKSITDLVSAGGVGHLFSRWLLVDRHASARLVTNSPTAPGEATDLIECRELLERLAAGDELEPDEQAMLDGCIGTFCRALMMFRKELPEQWQAPQGARAKDLTVPDDLLQAAQAFVLIFRFDHHRPERALTRHAAPSLYAKPLLGKIGQPDILAAPVWEAVVQLFRLRMRAQGSTANGGLPSIGPAPRPRTPDQALEDRIVTLPDIMIAVATAVSHPAAYKPIPRIRRITKLGAKMAQGGCSDTSIERAEQLRIDYTSYRRDRRNSVPGSAAEIQLVERILHRIADEETRKVRTGTAPWGDDLWAALAARLHDSPEELSKFHLDGDLSLGGISELTARCQIWYSEFFDVEAAIVSAKQQSGGWVCCTIR
ncbi:DUF4297 domain-containing protein [Mycobacteroides abscessus]|uniref:DUF4297 domain-containing protein n=1 Tax=Mycobacteroides abscessus TaxID=36809 RepID=UPI0009C5D267|nr:DUF4297 domain-containing protein [Mycobacteroides abscessus]MDM3918056.1 DUF4297 domain-containing protein [Mycobacteroides abscessus]SLH33086.1 Uncharacterised protein [Mycobacteroides abscessus subsp. massiliense]